MPYIDDRRVGTIEEAVLRQKLSLSQYLFFFYTSGLILFIDRVAPSFFSFFLGGGRGVGPRILNVNDEPQKKMGALWPY